MAQIGGTPILILREGRERTRGKDAQSRNIMAAKTIANAVKSTFGPKGMDKMLVDSMGDVVITNDGATMILRIDDVIASIAKAPPAGGGMPPGGGYPGMGEE